MFTGYENPDLVLKWCLCSILKVTLYVGFTYSRRLCSLLSELGVRSKIPLVSFITAGYTLNQTWTLSALQLVRRFFNGGRGWEVGGGSEMQHGWGCDFCCCSEHWCGTRAEAHVESRSTEEEWKDRTDVDDRCARVEVHTAHNLVRRTGGMNINTHSCVRVNRKLTKKKVKGLIDWVWGFRPNQSKGRNVEHTLGGGPIEHLLTSRLLTML